METVLLPELQESQLDDRAKLVLIDDDPDQLKVLTYRFKQQGYEVLTASSGKRGLELVRSSKPAAVVMDLGLPDVHGLEICRAIYDDRQLCHIPVVIVSGMEHADVVRQTRTAGASFYVRKPYDPNALLLLVRQAIADASSLDLD
jgi:DNA-binding response OmpR family regulator